jgi:hypothetical protein
MGLPSVRDGRGSIHEGEHLLCHHQMRLGWRALTQRDLRQAQAYDALRFQAKKSCVDGQLNPWRQHCFVSSRTELAAIVSQILDTDPAVKLIAKRHRVTAVGLDTY